MTGMTLPAACFCLMTGAVLGGLFLGCKLLRGLLYGGRLCAAVLDVLFCLVWALTAFLCALVIDKGRLRMFQMVLQGLGAWGTIVALDPFVNGLTGLMRRMGRQVKKWISRPIIFLMGRWRAARAAAKEKQVKKRKAAKKKKSQAKAGALGGKNEPRYRKRPSKREIYASKRKKTKNPLEKLT